MNLKKYDTSLINRRFKEKKMTMRQLHEITISVDPNQKGVALGTIQRVLNGGDALPNTLCLVCAALGISPGSLFVDRE
jgi:hypothetical protein